MPFTDLREWIEQVEGIGELVHLQGVDWDLELGAITDLACHRRQSAAVLFDQIKGYPTGYRILANPLGSNARLALTLGLDKGLDPMGCVMAWRQRTRRVEAIPPLQVTSGVVEENVQTGGAIDLWQFPAPRWHELDGGRYLGTGCVVITRDPETGVVNLGTYRGMVQGPNTLGLYCEPGKHARIHQEKHFQRGEPCPVAVCFGTDPLLFLFAAINLLYGESEYAYVGGIRGEAVEVIKGEVTGLPIPAAAEIAIEGEIRPGDMAMEGPFGEWTGYYGSSARPEPVIRVQRLLHRNNPIILGMPPVRPPSRVSYYRAIQKSALIWNALEEAGVPDVKGVWCHEAGGTRLFNVVAIRQRYPGHARQAGLIASQCKEGVRLGRYVVVVDDDIDPTNLEEVVWAMATRTDPVRSIELLHRCVSSSLDPAIPMGEKGFSSRAIIDACRPFEWLKEFPPVSEFSRERMEEVERRWGHLFPTP